MTHLCIDFGTSSTVAVVAGPQGARPVLFDGAPSLPSGVCADPAGRLLVGPDAAHAARTSPESYEPYPKQRIDERTVLLGSVEVEVPDLIAAVLRRVADQLSSPPRRVTITHPAAWGGRRREVLREAAARAGMRDVRLISEPVAAAAYFAGTAGATIPAGGNVVVCDLGAGTCDVSVIRRTPGGFQLLATSGLPDGGGLDLDAAIVAHLGAVYAPKDPAAWARLTTPVEAADRRAARALWADVRTGKEMLSRSSATHIHLPLLETEAPLGREQFEALARPVIERTVATTRLVLRESGVEASALHGVFLVGGASRVPLVASMLHRALSVAPVAVEQPELAVANGAATADDTGAAGSVRTVRQVTAAAPHLESVLRGPQVALAPVRGGVRPPPAETLPYPRSDVLEPRERRAAGAAAVPAGPPPRSRRWPVVLVALLVLAAVGAVALRNRDLFGADAQGGTGPTGTPPASGTPGTATGLKNDRGETLHPVVVAGVREANPAEPDAYRRLPGTDYATGGPFGMVVHDADGQGNLRFLISETDAESAVGDPVGPLWWSAPADAAEFFTINGGAVAVENLALLVNEPTYAESQVYDITFGPDLKIVTIRQR